MGPKGTFAAILVAAAAVSPIAAAQFAPPEAVEAAPLATDAFSTGTLTPADGALPETLWRGASARQLEFLLDNQPARPPAPSLGEAMRRILLSPAIAPDDAEPSLGGKKLLALARAGFVDEAATVASLSSAKAGDPWTGQAEAVSDLLAGDIQSACRRSDGLVDGRDQPFWVRVRVVCYAAAGERDAADLTLGTLRDQYGVSTEDDIFLTAMVTGVAPKSPPAAATPLQYAIARALNLPIAPGLLTEASGGVLVAVARADGLDPAARIAAAEHAVAMGVMPAAEFRALTASFEFDVAEISDAAAHAARSPSDPLTDALIYQSVAAMSAPEFIRDKAQRIALALSLAESFHRAYALSVLYADDIAALEGAIVAPQEAGEFAMARMAVGDAVGAARWLSDMIAPGSSVDALPEAEALRFIELVNLLALLDPQTAAQIARAANVSILADTTDAAPAGDAPRDPVVAAEILEAAFDAAIGAKPGQAGLVALAAARIADTPADAVVVAQSLKAAGLESLQRRYAFERAWAATFPVEDAFSPAAAAPEGEKEDRGFAPRLKPTSE